MLWKVMNLMMLNMMNKPTEYTLWKWGCGNIKVKCYWSKITPFKLLYKVYRNGKLLKDKLTYKPNMNYLVLLYGNADAHNKMFL